ncbi:hypothetical protein [Alistipes sp.]|uniref:hypothetical protein n=1 Tax=Alistipes sp. TaxID=1872444 RepID=UPI003995A057
MPKNNVPDVSLSAAKTVFCENEKAEMAFRRKYKFSIIDHLYYAGRTTTHPQEVVYAVGCYLLVGFRCCPFASYNKIPILGNTVVAAVSFVCRLGLGSSRGVFKD